MEEMNTNLTTIEEATDVVTNENNQPEESGSVMPLVIGGLVLGSIGAGCAYAYKKLKGNRLDRQIKKLEKAGYTVTPPELCEDDLVLDGEPDKNPEEE